MQAFMKKLGAALLAAAAAVLMATALSGMAVHQAYAAGASQAVAIEVQGHPEISVACTVDDLSNAGMLSSDKLGYQYKKPSGEWYVVGITNYVELSDLFDYAEVSQYWTSGATLHFTCTDGEYTKYYPTYEECTRANYFYQGIGATGSAPLTPCVKVPTVLGFSYAQVQVTGTSTAQDVINGLTASSFTADTRFGVGCTDDTVNADGTDGNMGKRMPQGITKITIVPAGAAS